MKDVILTQHEQIAHSLEVNKDVQVAPPADGEFDSIVLAGMGGSGHPGDLLNALGITKKPLFVHRNYDLPLEYLGQMGFKNTLVITSSYSGNTEEALSAYQQARENNMPLLVSSSGGKLEELAQQDGVPFCKIDFSGMQPRHTLFAAFCGIYAALRNSDLVKNIDDDLARVAEVLAEKTPGLEQAGKDLAEKIKGKVLVINSSDALGFATKNFKIQVNENTKYPAFWNTFPELNHNELMGHSLIKDQFPADTFFTLMIRNDDDHPRIKARIDVTTELYQQWGQGVESFEAVGETLLEKLFYTVTFGMWASYHLAEMYGVDPVPAGAVEEFKAKLKEVAGEV